MSSRPCVLITGGAGYIGSHTVVELVNADFDVTIVDNFVNSSPVSFDRIRKLVSHPDRITLIKADITDIASLDAAFASRKHDAVIHFAALKAVGESIKTPIAYYHNNIGGLLNVLNCMTKYSVPSIVFSSSATVYGTAAPPCMETSPVGVGITNPYGQTKFMGEQVLRDFHVANPSFSVALLRYFNPVGAHASGTIGEDPSGIPNNLMPYVMRVAAGKLPKLVIHGRDYLTPDGTAQRDFVHVVDLARGHLSAVNWLSKEGARRIDTFNLGTGRSTSVIEIVKTFEKVSGVTVAHEFGPRRAGDIPAIWADCSKAKRELGWEATLNVESMCADSWRWISKNPEGYATAAKA